MNDDAIGLLALGFAAFCLFLGMIQLAIGLILVILAVAVVVGAGLMTNLALRYAANRLDWKTIDEDWIWLVIAVQVMVPLGVGVLIAVVPPVLALAFASPDFLSAWLAAPVYLLWTFGYIWTWIDRRFEFGMADVLMNSALISTWSKLRMWWEFKRVEWNLG